MDPTATLQIFLHAVVDGDLDGAAQAARDYRAWILRGGFPAQVATAVDEYGVSILDPEQDRIGVCQSVHDAGIGLVEKWILCSYFDELQVIS